MVDLNNSKVKFISGLLFVFLVALTFRFWKLTDYPVHTTMDEVSIGYNAYSILHTGKDEWGVRLPLAFKSVGDYKPPVDIYLTVVSEAIFGLTEFAVRFPVAFLGALTAVCMAWLAKQLGLKPAESIIAGLFIAISPWHTHFSRASFEAVSALFLFVLGFALFMAWLEKRTHKLAAASAFSLGLSVWTYHSERAFIPIFVVLLFVIFKDKFVVKDRKIRKQLVSFAAVTLLLAIPFIYLTVFTPAVRTRALSTSIFRDVSLTQNLHNGSYLNFVQKLFDNDWYLIYRHWLGKYLNYFDLRFWFWKGMQFTPPGYPDLGLMYLADLPLFVAGIFALAKSKKIILQKIIAGLFFFGPIPASFTMNEQHPLRALVWLPFFAIIISMGFGHFLKSKQLKKYFLLGYGFLLLLNVVYFADIYMHHFPNYFSQYWQYGYKQAAIYACSQTADYDKIYISDTFGTDGPLNTGVPPLYVLFYCGVDPKLHLNGSELPNIHYGRPNWNEALNSSEKILYIAAPWDFPPDEVSENQIVGGVDYPSGEKAFLYVQNKI